MPFDRRGQSLGKVLGTVTGKVFAKKYGAPFFYLPTIRVIISPMGMAVFPEWVQAQKMVSELAERLGNTLNEASAR